MKNEIVIFKDLTTEEKLQEIEKQSEKYKGLIVDMNKPAERKKVKDSASLINGILKTIDRARIDKSKDFKSQVEAEAELIRVRLEIANEPLTALIDAHAEEQRIIREAEKQRQESIDQAFINLNDSALEAVGQTATVIESIIEDIESYDFDREVFQERTNEAIDKQAELIGKLNGMLEGAKLQEENEKKLARLAEFEEMERKQKAEKEQAERDEKIKAQADKDAEDRHARQIEEANRREDQARVDAERAAKQAEIDKLAAIEQAKSDVAAEQQRLAEIEAERLRKLEANKKHAGMVRGEIKTHLIQECGIDEKTAISVVKALLKTERVTINY